LDSLEEITMAMLEQLGASGAHRLAARSQDTRGARVVGCRGRALARCLALPAHSVLACPVSLRKNGTS
jgi:hypothetical protein